EIFVMKRLSPISSKPALRLLCLLVCCALVMPFCSLLFQTTEAAVVTIQGDPPDKNLPDLDVSKEIQNPSSKAPDPIPSTLANCSPYAPYCGAEYHPNAAPNPPPVVSIVSPINGATIAAGTTVTIATDASDT